MFECFEKEEKSSRIFGAGHAKAASSSHHCNNSLLIVWNADKKRYNSEKVTTIFESLKSGLKSKKRIIQFSDKFESI